MDVLIGSPGRGFVVFGSRRFQEEYKIAYLYEFPVWVRNFFFGASLVEIEPLALLAEVRRRPGNGFEILANLIYKPEVNDGGALIVNAADLKVSRDALPFKASKESSACCTHEFFRFKICCYIEDIARKNKCLEKNERR